MSDLLILEKPEQVLVTEVLSNTILGEPDQTLVVDKTLTSSVVTDKTGNLVGQEVIRELVVEGGVQGPPGVPGASTQFEYHLAATTLGGHRAVSFNNTGRLAYTDTQQTTSWVVGITTSSSLEGSVTQVQITGTLTEPSWNWTVGTPVFVGVDGVLTQTVPVTGQVLVIGNPVSPTKLFIDRQPPIYMG